MYGQDDYDIDEDNDEYLEDDRDGEEQDESDEGTISLLKIQSQLLCCGQSANFQIQRRQVRRILASLKNIRK